MSKNQTPKLTTTVTSFTKSPVQLATPSTTQTPVAIEHGVVFSAGEEPQYLVQMKDGTRVYMKESLLTQSGGSVSF